MRVFFDNCTPPWLASTLDGFISHYGHHACHIKDVDGLPKGRHTADIDWIEHIRAGKDWIFVSNDLRLLKNKAELAALRRSGLYGFVLASGYQSLPDHHIAANLIWRWPEIENAMRAVSAAVFEIPVKRGAKLRPLGL